MGTGRKVLRGGSWNNNWNNVRAANRNNDNPTNRNNNIGFRCVAASPGVLLKGQVRRVYGRGASAENEEDSRPVPGWVSLEEAQPKINVPRLVW
ncbi:SUMF1/EgtB/PvdO family nonheme iron enzyme [Chloroflexota bacterium]